MEKCWLGAVCVRWEWLDGERLRFQDNDRLIGSSLVGGGLWCMARHVKLHMDDKINVSGSA